MAVLPMAKINIYGLKTERKKILEAIQNMGMIDVVDFSPEDSFENADTWVSQSKFQKAKAEAEDALGILNSYSPEKKSMLSSLQGKTGISKKRYDELVSERDTIHRSALEIIRLEKSIGEYRAEIIRNQTNIEMLKPWAELAVPMKWQGTVKTAALIGAFPEAKTEEELYPEFKEACEKRETGELSIHIETVNKSENQTCVMVLCLKSKLLQTEEALRYMGFAGAAAACDELPRDRIKALEKRIAECEKAIEDTGEKIRGSVSVREKLKFFADYLAIRIDKYKVIAQLGQSKRAFALTGYVPMKDAAGLERELSEKYGAAVEYEAADDDAPVLLKNNGFAAPLEGVLETFSLPGKGEFDPTAAMAVFYYFLFGLMLSDAAYGILMVLICGIALWKFPRMNEGMKKSLKMYLYCGISTTFWGVMFGGYFGDAIQVIAKTFFDREIVIKPLWFSPIDEPMRMLMFSLGVGIVHLFAGLGLKLAALVRDKKYLDALYDVIFWYLLVGGGIVYLLTVPMFIEMSGLSLDLPSWAGTAAAICAAIGAVGIALTGGRSSRNPFKRLAKGLYELYNVSGYLSDILSYSRLLALGLATGVIANVFNKMGSMMGGGVVGAILFTIIFVIGHTLNIGINLLGAYVHTNRLQFVEFFGKFYEGGGRKYTPFRENTGYFDIENNQRVI